MEGIGDVSFQESKKEIQEEVIRVEEVEQTEQEENRSRKIDKLIEIASVTDKYEHIRTIPVPLLMCDWCNKCFAVGTDLNKHMKTNHMEVKCAQCNEQFNSGPNLEEYMKKAHEVKCDQSNKQLDGLNDMNDHRCKEKKEKGRIVKKDFKNKREEEMNVEEVVVVKNAKKEKIK